MPEPTCYVPVLATGKLRARTEKTGVGLMDFGIEQVGYVLALFSVIPADSIDVRRGMDLLASVINRMPTITTCTVHVLRCYSYTVR